MRISDQTAGIGIFEYNSQRMPGVAPAPSDPHMGRIEPDTIEAGSFAGVKKPPVSIGGDIIDFDWNRIRRFVQRFAWQAEPPDTVAENRDYWEKRIPLLSWDGDKAEFGSDRAADDKNPAFAYNNVENASPVKPKGECSTCSSRRYVDKSDDSSVSYQTPTKLNPSTAAMAVGSHEREHVAHERAKADRSGHEIVNQTVTIKYSICPECHRMYPSGGVTRTRSVKVADKPQSAPEDASSTKPQSSPSGSPPNWAPGD